VPRIAKKAGAYHHGDLRRVLLDAAVRVVEKEGVGALSLHALARKAGVSSGAPYHHFESREQLLAAIAVEGFERLAVALKEAAAEAEALAPAGPELAEAHLRGLGYGYVRFALAHRGYFRIMFRSELKAHLSKDQEMVVRNAFGMLVMGIARCQDEGLIPAGDSRRMVLLAWAAVHGASVLWIDGPLSTEGLVSDGEELGRAISDTIAGLLARGRRHTTQIDPNR
jgi:AcrR family transcriptional regulator